MEKSTEQKLSLSQKAKIKEEIMAGLSEERRREQKVKEQIKRYLSDKKIYRHKGDTYYKLSDYKHSFYVKTQVLEAMGSSVQEVELERAGYTENRVKRGFIKWDDMREGILLSTDRIRIYYKPYHAEAAY